MHAIDVVLFIHITAVLALFLAVGIAYTSMYGQRRARSVEVLRVWNAVDRRVGPVFPLGALVLAGAGAYLVNASGEFSMSDGWVQVGIAGLVFVEAVGGIVNEGHAKRVHKLLESAADGPLTPELHEATHEPAPLFATNMIVAMVTGIVFIMATKPSLATAIGVVIGTGLLGVASALPFARPREITAPAIEPPVEPTPA